MMFLHEKDLLARSGTRECYRVSHDPDRIVKIVRVAPKRGRDANEKEWRHYRYLMKRHGPLDFIPTCHGFVETNRGRGLAFDCVRDFDGSVSRMLMAVLADPMPYDRSALIASLTEFSNTVVDRNIQLFDLNLANIVIQRLSARSCRPVAVDLKGRYENYEFIPVSTYLPYFSRKKLARRCAALMARVTEGERRFRSA